MTSMVILWYFTVQANVRLSPLKDLLQRRASLCPVGQEGEEDSVKSLYSQTFIALNSHI